VTLSVTIKKASETKGMLPLSSSREGAMVDVVDLEALQKIGFCDVNLWGFRWDVERPDVILSLGLADGTRVELRCMSARDVHIVLNKRNRNAGPALSWDGAVSAAEDGTYELAFDFAGDGALSLKCDALESTLGP
jgi:hypothetical protein